MTEYVSSRSLITSRTCRILRRESTPFRCFVRTRPSATTVSSLNAYWLRKHLFSYIPVLKINTIYDIFLQWSQSLSVANSKIMTGHVTNDWWPRWLTFSVRSWKKCVGTIRLQGIPYSLHDHTFYVQLSTTYLARIMRQPVAKLQTKTNLL